LRRSDDLALAANPSCLILKPEPFALTDVLGDGLGREQQCDNVFPPHAYSPDSGRGLAQSKSGKKHGDSAMRADNTVESEECAR
jgi:hypothetical protein